MTKLTLSNLALRQSRQPSYSEKRSTAAEWKKNEEREKETEREREEKQSGREIGRVR